MMRQLLQAAAANSTSVRSFRLFARTLGVLLPCSNPHLLCSFGDALLRVIFPRDSILVSQNSTGGAPKPRELHGSAVMCVSQDEYKAMATDKTLSKKSNQYTVRHTMCLFPPVLFSHNQ